MAVMLNVDKITIGRLQAVSAIKLVCFSRRALNVEELGGMKRAGKDLEKGLAPGFVCYGIPVGSKEYVSHTGTTKEH